MLQPSIVKALPESGMGTDPESGPDASVAMMESIAALRSEANQTLWRLVHALEKL